MTNIIAKNKAQLDQLFKRHKVTSAYVFGSVLTEDWGEDSDIDVLINFQEDLAPLTRGELWWSLYDELRSLLGRNVDLITESSLKNPFFIEELKHTRQRIYG